MFLRSLFSIWSFVSLTILALPAGAAEQQPRLTGQWPLDQPSMTVALNDVTVNAALSAVLEQTGWGLVLTVDNGRLDTRIDLTASSEPAGAVLETILRHAGLRAAFENGVVYITDRQHPEKTVMQLALDSDEDWEGDVRTLTSGTELDVDVRDETSHHRIRIQPTHVSGFKNRVQIGQSISVSADEQVGDVVSIGGSISIAGHVHGEAVAIGGDVTLLPGAVLEHDATALGGQVNVAPGAALNGDRVGMNLPLLGLIDGISGLFGVLDALSVVFRSILLLSFTLLLIWLIPERIERTCAYLNQKTGYAVLAGSALFVGFFPLLIVVAISIVGLLVIPLLVLFWLALLVFGLCSVMTWIGYAVPLFQSNKTRWHAALIGAAIVFLVSLIPYAGPVILTGVTFVAAGAVLLSRFGAKPKMSPAVPSP